MTIPPEIQVNGKWRPTRNSRGRLIHPTPEGILAFWKWFGGSKAVDQQGRPLIWYHGTARPKIGKFHGDRGVAGHFTLNAEMASDYAYGQAELEQDRIAAGEKDLGEYAQIYPVYIKVENIYDCGGDVDWEKLEYELLPDLYKQGFDSYVDYENMGEEPTGIAVFSPTQIKSATGNRGTFDPEDPVMTNPRRRRRK